MPGQGHLHAVPGGEVFVYDLPASQVAHPACNLDSHVDQVLLRDRLKGNEGKREKDNETGKKKVRSVERRAEIEILPCSNCSYCLGVVGQKMRGLLWSLNENLRMIIMLTSYRLH